MAKLSSRYAPNIYNEFKDLNGAEPRELARFYEQNHTLIQNLDQHEYFDLQVSYLVALFELGQYDKLLTIVDEPIEACIIHNIQKHNGKDVFRKLLYIKGESSFHLMKFDEAKYIFLELIKMDNKNSFYKEGLSKTLRKITPQFVKNGRALCIFFFILSALVIAFEVLVVKHFFSDYASIIEFFRNALFVLGWATLIGSELIHYFKVQQKVNAIAKR